MANAGGNGSGGDAGMSWLENFKPPSPAPPEQPPPSYEASIRDDDPSETAKASEIHPSSSAIEEASAARGDPPREAPEPETDAPVASGPSRRTSGTARPDSDLEPPRRAEPRGASPIAVPSVAEEEKREKREERKDDDAATIRSLRSEVAVSAAAAEDASAALEAMSLKVETLARLLDEASRERDEERRKRMAKEDDASDQSAKKKENEDASSRDDVSARLAASESERAELVSKVTRLETRVASLSNDLRAAREIARSTGELADQSATYIAELKKKHRALETRERETRAELALKNAEARDVRKNTHDAKLETETFRVETNRLTETIVALKKKLRAAEDALEDGRRESAGGAAARDELETLREEHRALLDAEKTFARRLRDAEDAAADAELRAADAELACEAVRADAAAELERETEKLQLELETRSARGGGGSTRDAAETRAKQKDASPSRDASPENFTRGDALEEAERRAREAEARVRALEAERDAEADRSRVFVSERDAEAERSRAERAERALEAARLLSRPSAVTESDAELVRMRDAGKRAAETERRLRETLDALEKSEARARDAEVKRSAAESDARVLVARAKESARAKEKERERGVFLSDERASSDDGLKDGKGDERASLTSGTRFVSTARSTLSDESDFILRETHAKRVTLRFLEAPSFDEQQAVLPVLAAVQRWDPSERRAVDKARASYWEPAEKALADRLSALSETDLGVTSAANALAGALGLGDVL